MYGCIGARHETQILIIEYLGGDKYFRIYLYKREYI